MADRHPTLQAVSVSTRQAAGSIVAEQVDLLDRATGRIVSQSWNKLDPSLKDELNGVLKIAAVVPGGRGVAIASKATQNTLKEFGHSIQQLSTSAMKPINKEGLTEAARALTKHASGQRLTGTFPKLSGGILKQNEEAQKIVNGILNNPESTFTRLGRGGLNVRAPDGQGLRFESDGTLSGFLDPKRDQL